MYGYIYLIVNNLNGKTYVGQRKCSRNWTEDKYYMGSGRKDWNTFQKEFYQGDNE